VQADSVALSFDHYGESGGTPLVVAHGLFGSSTNWRGICRKLGERHSVFAVDMRNHGESPWSDRHDYPALAADLGAFIAQHCNGSAIVVGHSMGGKAAMTLAMTQPERVRGLVVVDIAPVNYGHTHDPYIDAMLDVDAATLSSRSEADTQLAATIPEKPIRQFLTQNLVRADVGFRWRINLPVLQTAMPDLISFSVSDDARYDGPATFIHGKASNYVTDAQLPAIRQHFPDAQVLGVTKAGHWVHAEAPTPVINAIDETVNRVLGA